MKHFIITLLVGFWLLGPHAFADVSAKNGISITTASTINGKTPNSAFNGLAIASSGIALSFFWGMEGTTYYDAEVALGSGSGTLLSAGTGSSVSTVTYKVGTHAYLGAGSGSETGVEFAPAANIDHLKGSVGFWFRRPSSNDLQGLFLLRYDDDNRIFILTPDSDKLRWFYKAANTGFDITVTTGTSLSLNTWYFLIMRWDKAGNAYSIAVYDDSETLMFSSSSTASTGTWAGSPTSMKIGDWVATSRSQFLDSVMVSADDQADLLSIRNTTYP